MGFRIRAILFLLGSLGLASCVNFEPRTNPVKQFALGPVGALPQPDASLPSVYVLRPELPTFLVGDRIYARAANGELSALHGARWAEPLSEGIARCLSEWIRFDSGALVSGYYPWPMSQEPSVRLKIKLLQCDFLLNGRFDFAAEWLLQDSRSPESPIASGFFMPDESVWEPGDPASAAKRLDETLRLFAREVAVSLRKESVTNHE